MIELYFNLVVAGKRTCDRTNENIVKVPEKLINQVSQLLNERGYDDNGVKI